MKSQNLVEHVNYNMFSKSLNGQLTVGLDHSKPFFSRNLVIFFYLNTYRYIYFCKLFFLKQQWDFFYLYIEKYHKIIMKLKIFNTKE